MLLKRYLSCWLNLRLIWTSAANRFVFSLIHQTLVFVTLQRSDPWSNPHTWNLFSCRLKVGSLAAHYQVPLRHILLVKVTDFSILRNQNNVFEGPPFTEAWCGLLLRSRFTMRWLYQMGFWDFNRKEVKAITTGMYVCVCLLNVSNVLSDLETDVCTFVFVAESRV